MEKFGPKYIGPVTLTAVRDWILDNAFSEQDTILLHPATMANVAEDYRQLYREPLPNPYFLLGVLVEAASDVQVPENRAVALLNDKRLNRPVQQPASPPEPTDDGRDVFRCGNCGSLVTKDGELLEGAARTQAIGLLRLRDGRGAIHVHGECCQYAEDEQ